MVAAPGSRQRLWLGLAALLVSLLVLAVLWNDITKGFASLGWQRAPATTVVAYYHREYDPEGSLYMDGPVHKSWSGLSLAYATPEGRHFVTSAFDAAGLTPGREWFLRPASSRIRYILNVGDATWVYYNPRDPGEAVIQRGLPYTTGVALFLPLSLLALVLASLRSRSSASSSAKPLRLDAAIPGWIALMVFFAIIGAGLTPFWVSVTGYIPPWWLLPACSIWVIAMAVFPQQFSHSSLGSLLGLIFVVLLVVSAAGIFMSETEPFGKDWTEKEYIERLAHGHPAVAEYAILHFVRHTAPEEALEPLRKLVLESPALENRRYAVQALHRMEGGALPALPDLQRALDDPGNEPIREDLESTLKTLDNIQRFREGHPNS